MLEKKKLRDIAESISGIRPENRSLEGIVNFIEEKAEITYEKEPRTFLGRLRELGYALNGVRPTQRSLRGIVNNIYDNFNPEPPVPPIPENAILGVSGMYDESVNLTRTDDAVGMTYTKNLDGTVTSDFDNVFPYNEMQKVVIHNSTVGITNVFVKIPSMWFRIGTTVYNQITDIAVSQVKGEGDNWYQTKEFYYGAYKGVKIGTGKENWYLTSKYSNLYPSKETKDVFRELATNNGEGYQQLDLYHRTILYFLFLIEFANKRTADVFPMTFDSLQKVGLTDSISSKYPTGALANGRFRWRYIEDVFGNAMEYIEGISGNYYASSDTSKYASEDFDELPFSNTMSASYINCLYWDSSYPFLVMARTSGSIQYFGGESTGTMDNGDMNFSDYVCGKSYTDNVNNYTGFFSFDIVEKEETVEGLSTARLLYCPNGV